MKLQSAVALFILTIVTECLSAQSERARQRSGPIRSVPVAADIKRDADFDCPEEFGYYPHPTDCTLYYVCVFGGALLESCTGGLMYSHELQTCDWPRNVGCDGTSAVTGEEIERINGREHDRDPPPPPPPRRTPPPPPPPPPRAQPNPIVTSRGQPKFNRDEYEKQQQLYAEVDDLPPVEEIESDRQQRVYRGQPSTIGQVQKDRDGYGSQVVSSRTINANIIPASIPQSSGKVGSFSFGTHVDERRTATATPSPQSYSEDKIDITTDSLPDRLIDTENNEIDMNDKTQKLIIRKKRDVSEKETLSTIESHSNVSMNASKRNEGEFEYVEVDPESEDEVDEISLDDFERGKRQVRYYLQKNYKNPGKNWPNSKPIRFVDFHQYNYNHNNHVPKHQQSYNNEFDSNNYHDSTRKPIVGENSVYSTANPFVAFQGLQYENQSQRPFKPSLPDPFERSPHTPMNIATQIITKSPPISALQNNENPFSSLAGGFFNNIAQNTESDRDSQNTQYYSQSNSASNRPSHQVPHQDSSLLPSTVVTGKPVQLASSPRPSNRQRINAPQQSINQSQKVQNIPSHHLNHNQSPLANHKPESDDNDEEEYDDEESDEENNDESEESEKNDDYFKHQFPEPPYEFRHPSNRFADIENPFANPNFDFDAFLAKLRGDTTISVTTRKPQSHVSHKGILVNSPESTTAKSSPNIRPSSLTYEGMSTPRPFSSPTGPETNAQKEQNNYNLVSSTENAQKFQNLIQLPHNHKYSSQQTQQQTYDENLYSRPQQNAGIPLGAVRPKLKPPNFKDDRQLPISYSFDRPMQSTSRPYYDKTKGEHHQIITVTQKPYVIVTGTGSPIILSTPKQQFIVKPDKVIAIQPHMIATGKPYLVSSINPHNPYIAYKQSTQKPLTTLANEQLSALQNYWKNPSTEFYFHSTSKPTTLPDISKLEKLFAQVIGSSTGLPHNAKEEFTPTTTRAPPKRRLIPKPSPEMNDYYYDEEDEQYYSEPPVKSKYMPSTEVKPQRPPMAQNYQEYEDFEDSEEKPVNHKRPSYRKPTKFHANKPESVTKNHNDVSVVTKSPMKDSNKFGNGKPISVLVDYGTPAPNVIVRPEISNYEVHHKHRNKTMFFRRPTNTENGPFTLKPPKFLNKTTLRPYTVRHRLAKPTTVKDLTSQSDDKKQVRGRMRHHNIVVQMKLTTPRDSQKQETRYTKTKHDDKTNSLEPTESVTPSSYSASPRPKMLYNGTQNYSPDQYDPYYAVYDEDGELYKDTDYVQQYNIASLRPAVQQTYRGTPPPSRRPVDNYTPRPTQDDYDDALIHGQINNQNQYQAPIRHSTRGEGNELGYDNNPSSVKTTVYEATSLSTTPSTTSTTSTTQRPTTAPFTEAMTPSRYTPRSSTDENLIRDPDPSSENPPDGSALPLILTSPSPMINLSSLAKPFQKTENSYRLQETVTSTEKLLTSGRQLHVTNRSPGNIGEVKNDNKKVVSLTTGFSIRRNPSNSNNPYTLTVLTRPFDHFNKSQSGHVPNYSDEQHYSFNPDENNDAREISIESQEDTYINGRDKTSELSMRRKDSSSETASEEDDIPIYTRPTRKPSLKPRIKLLVPSSTPGTTKYYLKTVIKRPAPFGSNIDQKDVSRENTINTDALIEAGLQNARAKGNLDTGRITTEKTELPKWLGSSYEDIWSNPTVSPYRTLENLRNYQEQDDESSKKYSTTTTTSTPVNFVKEYIRNDGKTTSKPAYYSYKVLDEDIPDQTTEVLSSSVRNIIKAFFNNFSPTPKIIPTEKYQSLPKITTTTVDPIEKVVNIGYQKKHIKYVDEKPLRNNNINRLQIITEPNLNNFVSPSVNTVSFTDKVTEFPKHFSSTSTTTEITSPELPETFGNPTTTPLSLFNAHKSFESESSRDMHNSKFNFLVTKRPEIFSKPSPFKVDESQKFNKMINEKDPFNNFDNALPKLTNTEQTNDTTEFEWNSANEIATTTSTTKSTTLRTEHTTSTTKSVSFPTRPSRVNPAIKLAATNPGGGRRSYQSTSKCSSDNSLQANPKCNEIKYQRPSSTRGRGSAHYSTLSGSDGPQQQTVNRGTPPTRSRPTLKPSTAVVTNTNPTVDIYNYPPRRPGPVYPQPTPDKTAAKCRKDVCLLPDCYCGGKDIPGDLPVESVPQIVLLTFDDSVNDLNKGLYSDLFEKGRVNPNGCPISATFYVSHEWTDYSQVQNLYSGGHEMASHTISHSFGEQFSQKKWNREVGGQREILAAYGGVKLEDVRGMRAPFLSVGGNKMFKMLYDSNFTYDSSLPVYENRPPSWPYTLDYKLFHDCMIPPCPTKSYPGVWEVPMVMWQDLNGGRCSMGDACANPPEAEGVYKMLLKNFDRHYTTNRAPFGLFYHAAWFTQPHHKEGFIMFLDFINQMNDVWIVTNWQALQWVRDPTPISRLNNFQPFQCNYQDRPKKCNNPKVCNLWHKSGVRYMRTCQPCPEVYPWTGKTGIRSSRIDNDIEE